MSNAFTPLTGTTFDLKQFCEAISFYAQSNEEEPDSLPSREPTEPSEPPERQIPPPDEPQKKGYPPPPYPRED